MPVKLFELSKNRYFVVLGTVKLQVSLHPKLYFLYVPETTPVLGPLVPENNPVLDPSVPETTPVLGFDVPETTPVLGPS